MALLMSYHGFHLHVRLTGARYVDNQMTSHENGQWGLRKFYRTSSVDILSISATNNFRNCVALACLRCDSMMIKKYVETCDQK